MSIISKNIKKEIDAFFDKHLDDSWIDFKDDLNVIDEDIDELSTKELKLFREALNKRVDNSIKL